MTAEFLKLFFKHPHFLTIKPRYPNIFTRYSYCTIDPKRLPINHRGLPISLHPDPTPLLIYRFHQIRRRINRLYRPGNIRGDDPDFAAALRNVTAWTFRLYIDRRHDLVGFRIDPRDGAISLVKGPHALVANADKPWILTHRYSGNNNILLGIHPLHRAFTRVRYPNGAIPITRTIRVWLYLHHSLYGIGLRTYPRQHATAVAQQPY